MQERIEFKKKVIQLKGDARKDCLETMQKDIEDGRKILLTPQSWKGTGRKGLSREVWGLMKGGYSSDRLEKPESSAHGKMQPGAWPKKSVKKASGVRHVAMD